MVREARTDKSNPTAPDRTHWRTTQELWDRASRTEIDLERAGKEPNRENVWQYIKKYAPAHLQASETMPPEVTEALEHPGYKQLLDLRKRLLVIPGLKDLGLLKDASGQAAYIALNSALEDLLLHPERIPVSEKRQLARTFMEMNLRLSGIKAEEEAGPATLTDIAAQEEAERSRVLDGIPEAYRELMGQRWDEERLKSLRSRQAIHTVEISKKLSHAKSG